MYYQLYLNNVYSRETIQFIFFKVNKFTLCHIQNIGVNKSASESITECNNTDNGKSMIGVRRCNYIIIFHV